MFCRTYESLAAVYNIEIGHPNQSAMERTHQGWEWKIIPRLKRIIQRLLPTRIAYSPPTSEFFWDFRIFFNLTKPLSRVCANKKWFITAIENPIVFAY